MIDFTGPPGRTRAILSCCAALAISGAALGFMDRYEYIDFNKNPYLPRHTLDTYTLLKGPIAISEIGANASGLTFNNDTNTLFLVVNSPTSIVELSSEGDFLRSIVLNDFHDTESITYLGDNRFAVAEERRSTIATFTIDADTRAIDYADAAVYPLAAPDDDNKGLEGITYCPDIKAFYAVKEKSPRQIYHIASHSLAERGQASTPWNIERDNLWLDDLSDIHYDSGTGNIILLSDESRALMETTPDGTPLSRLFLRAGNAGLSEDIPQPEGLALGGNGYLYVCSEPNLLYIFHR